MKVAFTANAIDRLQQIHSYISADSPENANRLIERIIRRAETLAQHPTRGRAVPEYARDDVREISEPPFRIIYLVSADSDQHSDGDASAPIASRRSDGGAVIPKSSFPVDIPVSSMTRCHRPSIVSPIDNPCLFVRKVDNRRRDYAHERLEGAHPKCYASADVQLQPVTP